MGCKQSLANDAVGAGLSGPDSNASPSYSTMIAKY